MWYFGDLHVVFKLMNCQQISGALSAGESFNRHIPILGYHSAAQFWVIFQLMDVSLANKFHINF